jgi:hypothetical protein
MASVVQRIRGESEQDRQAFIVDAFRNRMFPGL